MTLILLWNQETQCKYLEKSTKEYKFDFFKDLCDEIRKEILKLFSELINNSTLNLEDVKDVTKYIKPF